MEEQTTQAAEKQKVVYETLNKDERRYGSRNNKFLEVSRKKAPDGNEFLTISKGFYNREEQKRYETSVGFPLDESLKQFIIDGLQKI